mgnify:CR=1 FL=1
MDSSGLNAGFCPESGLFIPTLFLLTNMGACAFIELGIAGLRVNKIEGPKGFGE